MEFLIGLILANELYNILSKYNLDIIYTTTFIIVLAHIIFDLKHYRNWKSISFGKKFYTVTTLIAAIFFIILSLMRFLKMI
jgi:hypothetical protein